MTPSIAVVHDGCGEQPGGAAKVSVRLAQVLEADLYVGRTGCREWYDAKAPQELSVYARHANRLPTMLRDTFVAYRSGKLHLPKYEIVVSSGAAAKFYQPESFQRHVHYTHHPPLRYAQWLGRGSLGGVKGNLHYVFRKGAMYLDWLEMQRVETVLANSQTTQERIRRHYRRDSVVVTPPIEYSEAPVLGPANREEYFLYVGRLGTRKRLETLVDAFSQSDERLIIAGDGPLRKQIQRRAREANGTIEFRGWVSDEERERLMREARGGIYLPEEEDFGMAIAELLCWGTPVIVPDEPNPRHMVFETNGIRVQPNVEAVADALDRFDPSAYDNERIAKEARDRYSPAQFESEVVEVVLGE